jgi:hypothetical protein
MVRPWLWIALCERTPALEDEGTTQHRATRDDFNICGSVVEQHTNATRVFMAAYFDDIVEIAVAYRGVWELGNELNLIADLSGRDSSLLSAHCLTHLAVPASFLQTINAHGVVVVAPRLNEQPFDDQQRGAPRDTGCQSDQEER